jgi:hypothetical protein
MKAAMPDVADPRSFPDASRAPQDAQEAFRLAVASLEAGTGQEAQAFDAALDARIDALLAGADTDAAGRRLASWLEAAPSVAVHRRLWRAIVGRASLRVIDGDVAITLFAIPLVVVAGVGGPAETAASLPGVLADAPALAGLLATHGALGGNRTFAIASSLVAADALDVARLPALVAAHRQAVAQREPLELPPAGLALPAGESVHLRFLVGSAVSGAGTDVARDETTGRWGMPLTRALSAQLAAPGATLLALPRPAQTPLAAAAQGRIAQRDVSAQLFASNAIRALRASVGEPAAVISAHVAPEAPGGGELRLSLSSTFSPRDAYGLRCPILPGERAVDAVQMLVDLLADARVTDVVVVPGVHADRDPVTGGPLMFKPGTLPAPPGVH